jgi:hypothetical protein
MGNVIKNKSKEILENENKVNLLKKKSISSKTHPLLMME